jgi:hypothetical protein
MRTSLLAVAALVAAVGAGCSTVGSGQSRGGGGALAHHSCPYCNREAAVCQQSERETAQQQVQLAGYNAPCPDGNCDPAAAGAAGYAQGGGPAYGGPYEGYGPYAQYGPRPFDGGWYGPFGGAHRTPGYPKHHMTREYVGPQGPPTAQVAYPYYTCRGPRDFLVDNPPSIGR